MRKIVRITRCWRFWIGLVAVVAGEAWCAAEEETDGQRLLNATCAVDRVVVIPPIGGDSSGLDSERVLFEIKGREAIAELVRMMEFKPSVSGPQMPCLCYGTHRLEFYAGKNFKFSLSYHHWNRLRGDWGGPWLGDAVLTDKGCDQVVEWFAGKGFTEFKMQMALSDAEAKARDARVADIAALFPDEARTWFPAIDHNASWNPETRIRSAALAGLYADKAELLLTVWQAFGRMREWPGSASLLAYGEPSGFLSEAVSKIPADDYGRALVRLPE